MNIRHRLVPISLLGVCIQSAAWGADPAVPQQWPVSARIVPKFDYAAITPDTRRLVKALGDADYQIRSAAAAELESKGVAAFPGLELLAAETPDPEVQALL